MVPLQLYYTLNKLNCLFSSVCFECSKTEGPRVRSILSHVSFMNNSQLCSRIAQWLLILQRSYEPWLIKTQPLLNGCVLVNYCCAYCNFSTSLGHIQSIFQARNFGFQCLKVSFPAPSLSHCFQLIHYSTTLTFQCLYLLQINKICANKLVSNSQRIQGSQQFKSN